MKRTLLRLALIVLCTVSAIGVSGQVTPPYTTGFEDATDNLNWTFLNTGQTNQWFIGSATNNGGSNALYISNNNGTANTYSHTTSYAYAYISIELSPGAFNYAFDWKAYAESCCDYLRVFLVPSSVTITGGGANDIGTTGTPTGWIALDGASKLNLQTNWIRRTGTVNITTDDTYKVVFYWKNDGSVGTAPPAAIDNIELLQPTFRACRSPQSFIASGITQTAATVSWTSTNALVAYNVKVSTTAINPETTPGNIYDDVSYDPYVNLFGLTPNTRYYVYVQSDCGTAQPSLWASYEFMTSCAAIPVPYIEDFTAYGSGTTAYAQCWSSIVLPTGNTPTTNVYTPYIVSGTSSPATADGFSLRLFAYFSSSTLLSKTIAVMPELAVANINSLSLRFDAYSTSTNAPIRVGVMDDFSNPGTFTEVAAFTAGAWDTKVVSFRNYTGTGKYIAFLVDGDEAQATYTAYIDRIRVEPLVDCMTPMSLTATTVNAYDATLDWVTMSVNDNVVQVQVSLINTTRPDTLTSFVMDTIMTNASSVVVNNLAQRTTYYAYIRVRCADGSFSDYILRPTQFTTGCGLRPIPYLESFDTYGSGSGVYPDCWTVGGTYSTNPYISTSQRISTPGSLYFYTSSSTFLYAATQEIAVPLNNLMVTFSVYKTSASYDVILGVMTDPSDITTFQAIQTVSPSANSAWEEFEISLASYTGSGRYIAFMVDGRVGSIYKTIYLDDLRIEYIPSCIRPGTLTFSGSTDSQITVAFTPRGTETSWDVVYGPVGFDPATSGTWLTNVTSPVTIPGLPASTYYDVYVRANCGAGDYSAWRGPTRVFTQQTVEALPFITGFEDATDNAKWLFTSNTGTNKFAIGTATNNGGSRSLYVTNDNGTSNAYTTSSVSYTYAYRTFSLPAGQYELSFNWKANGESTWDLLRAFLVPSNVDLSTGDAFGMTGSTNTDPSGWIDVAGGIKNLVTTWQTRNSTIMVPTTGVYKLIFFWKNDGSGGTQPPAAVDNINFVVSTCYTPVLSPVVVTGGTTASLSWGSDATTWEIIVSTVPLANNQLDTLTSAYYIDRNATTPSLTLSGLPQGMLFYYYVRGTCVSLAKTNWANGQFRTPAPLVTLPFVATFEVPTEDGVWETSNSGGTNKWYIGTAEKRTGNRGLYISNNNGTSNAYSTSPINYSYTWVTANFDNTLTYAMSFDWKGQGESTWDLLRAFLIPASVDLSAAGAFGMSGSTNTVPAGWTDIGNGVKNLQATWQSSYATFTVPTTGDYKIVLFWKNDGSGGTQPPAAVDNVRVNEALCMPPTAVSASLAGNTVTVSWTPGSSAITSWRVKLDVGSFDPEIDPTMIDTVVHSSPLVIPGLSYSTTYTVYVENHCALDSMWSGAVTFTTPCGPTALPFTESFSGTPFPALCWDRYNALASNVFTNPAYLASTTGGWTQVTTGYGISGTHTKANIYGTSARYWIVSPQLVLSSPALLEFDLALTAYNSANAPATNVPDDKFMVIVSRDRGRTWSATNATVWDNAGTNYVYNQIPRTAQRIALDLTSYMGDTVRIAFYGESTVSGGDNDLHIGNVSVTNLVTTVVSDTICQDHAYSGNGFTIAASRLGQSGINTFSRLVTMPNNTYQAIQLNLYVSPTKIFNVRANICVGDSYSGYGFTESAPGIYRRAEVATNGCDSAVVLNLTYLDPLITYQYDTITHLPFRYIYAGMIDTTFMAASTLPGEYEYEFHVVSVGGCDSVVHTLYLKVDNGVPIDISITDNFVMSPNPVSRGGYVQIHAEFTEADRKGMVVEVFNSVGARVMFNKPDKYPIVLDGFDTNGLFIIRLTTGKGEVYHSKLIVK